MQFIDYPPPSSWYEALEFINRTKYRDITYTFLLAYPIEMLEKVSPPFLNVATVVLSPVI
jgi:hypothetical protein